MIHIEVYMQLRETEGLTNTHAYKQDKNGIFQHIPLPQAHHLHNKVVEISDNPFPQIKEFITSSETVLGHLTSAEGGFTSSYLHLGT